MKNLMFSLVVMMLIGSTAECATWELMDTPTTEGLRDVWGTASNNVYAVGYSGTILHYDGTTWGQLPQQTTTTLLGVSGSGPNDVYVVGHGETESTVLRYDGDTWESLPMPDVAYDIYLEDIWVSGSDAFAVGYHGAETGQIIHWQNGNLSSHNVIDGPLGSTAFCEVWGRGSDDVYASGYDGYSSGTTGLMYHYDGTNWEPFPLPQDVPSKTRGVYGIWSTNDSSELFLAGASYGGPSDWFAEALYYDGTGWQTEIFQGSTQSVLMEVWGSSLNDVYLVGYNYNGNGMILHGSSEFSWSMMDSGTTEWLTGIWGSGPDDIFVVGSNGTILRLVGPIEEITDFIDKSVDDGTLIPVKDGKPGQGQLGAFINMIEAAGNLIEGELLADACWQLQDALEKTDGLSPPESAPDFVTGPAAPELAAMIEALMDCLGCDGSL